MLQVAAHRGGVSRATPPASKLTRSPSFAGLPEEVRIRTAALRLGYAVVAVSSGDRRGARCWDVRRRGEESADGRGVARILTEIRRREGLDHAALYALGASSGGAFVLMLPQLAEVQASDVGGWVGGHVCLGILLAFPGATAWLVHRHALM